VSCRSALLILATLALVACGGPSNDTAAQKHQRPPGKHDFWSDDSPWNTPLTGHEKIDPNSTKMIADQIAHSRGGPVITWKRYGVPIYDAAAGTPRASVKCLRYGCANLWLRNVPLPRGMYPAGGSDAQLTVLDADPSSPTHGCMYDFWKAGKKADGSFDYSAPRGGFIQRESITESGWVDGSTTRGSSAANMAGMITPAELQAGAIDHALGFNVYLARDARRRSWLPSHQSDGSNRSPDAIPEGARIRLNPRYDASRLPAWQQTIATALKTYGAFVVDQGGNEFEAIDNSHGGRWSDIPYPWGTTTYPSLPLSMEQALQVIQLDGRRRVPVNNDAITDHPCGNFYSSPRESAAP
jgi:hypothetical protein